VMNVEKFRAKFPNVDVGKFVLAEEEGVLIHTQFSHSPTPEKPEYEQQAYLDRLNESIKQLETIIKYAKARRLSKALQSDTADTLKHVTELRDAALSVSKQSELLEDAEYLRYLEAKEAYDWYMKNAPDVYVAYEDEDYD